MRDQMVTCEKHAEERQLAYIACKHVLYQGALVGHHIQPEKHFTGEILCEECLEALPRLDPSVAARLLQLLCRKCALECCGERLPV